MKKRPIHHPRPKKQGPPRPAGPSFPLPGPLRRILDQVAARVAMLRIIEGLVWIVGVAAAMLLARCLLDRLLEFPRPLRIVLIFVDAAWIGWLAWRFPLRALIRREPRDHCALRIEKRWPRLQSSLISTVQLAQAGPSGAHGSPEMLQRLFHEARHRAAGIDAKSAVPGSHLRKPALGAAALVLLVALLSVLNWTSAQILTKRYLGFNEPLPSLTRVYPISKAVSLPVGSSATLAARAEGYLPRSGRLLARYEDGQNREFPVVPDPADPAVFQFVMQNVQSSFTYQFVLNDGHGDRYPVTSLLSPVIRALTAVADFPAYTGWKSRELKPSEFTVLNGTTLSLSITASQPLKSATWLPKGAGEPLKLKIDPGNSTKATLTVALTSPELTGFSIALVNSDGIPSGDDALHSITVTMDKPPEVKLLQPADPPETITPAGGIDIVAEITDDFGLSEVSLCVETAGPDGLGETRRTRLKVSAGQPLAFRWLPGKDNPPPKIGDSLTYYIEAKDTNTASGPGVGKSTLGSVTIVTPEAKQEEIDQKLREKAAEINYLRESQRAITDDLNKVIQEPNQKDD